ncbi:hypothetical protein PUR50_31660, partial [Enterobacter hormaechei subsp. steigerwaltii]|nr:hypothetical protein [Enterobacter hormaechei subsp. steigerwaltii]
MTINDSVISEQGMCEEEQVARSKIVQFGPRSG